MAKTPAPDFGHSSERLQVACAYARLRLGFGGELLAALSGVTSNAYRVAALSLCPHVHLAEAIHWQGCSGSWQRSSVPCISVLKECPCEFRLVL
jgi:hypothetical protein